MLALALLLATGVQALDLARALETTGRVALYLPFEFGKSAFEPGAERDLEALAGLLKRKPDLRLVIAGHAYSLATPEQNMALSDSRTKAVFNALTARGVGPGRLSRLAKGEEEPLERREDRVELVDPGFSGLRDSRAVQLRGALGKEASFARSPAYFIAFTQDRYEPGGSSQVFVYAHPDAGLEGARLPTQAQILAQYAQAARSAGGYLTAISSWTLSYQIGGAAMTVRVPRPERYYLTVTKGAL